MINSKLMKLISGYIQHGSSQLHNIFHTLFYDVLQTSGHTNSYSSSIVIIIGKTKLTIKS